MVECDFYHGQMDGGHSARYAELRQQKILLR